MTVGFFTDTTVCIGCKACEVDGRAWKCTLCYDRLGAGTTPACAQVCPTESIVFGELSSLRARAEARVAQVDGGYLYGLDQEGTDGLHAFFLLTDEPEVYNLPSNPVAPSKTHGRAWKSMALAGFAMAIAAVVSGRR